MKELSTRYNPQNIEEKIYDEWEKEKLFHADENAVSKTYCIVIPPPNITGILHMGHALNNTIQDILIRWKRLQGFNVLWMPGTDHAGIATQNVVERELFKQNLKRSDLGREKFIEKVWQWKESYGNTIIRQLKRLGCSCDWDRKRFTMDYGLSNAVKEVFVRLYEDGLIYRGDYIINWCPRCMTALSEEEAEHRQIKGMLYYIKYPVKGREKIEKENEDYVVVATTRPETMLGDTAVAINPKDKRYAALKGKTLILPIVKRDIGIIFDKSVDPEFGTGALKVTPAHDPADFELGNKYDLERVNVMNPDGSINSLGMDYEGMDRFECRQAIIEDLKQRKLFIKAEEHIHAVGHCYRCHTIVEPMLSKQWFVSMKPLAKEAIKAVKEKKIKFYPARWTKVYLNWMENIRDWCISRQIWWGHRIPVWYCKDCLESGSIQDVEIKRSGEKGVYALREERGTCPGCGSANIEQSPDVLDTWFSSWLWPFSTLGWPEEKKELKLFYPTDVLVTAQEIIFFWVARMIMAGLKFQKDIPFRDVYIHGTVRDETGTKMSKSLGNVIDPIEVINEVGSDALRYSLISITSQGQDVFLSKEKFEIGRNFLNKLWNASRYVLMSMDEDVSFGMIKDEKLTLVDRWILSSLNDTIRKVTKSFETYRFNDAASELYDFIWHKYCDWYIELFKFYEDKKIAQKVLLKVLKEILSLLHPIMPFITEEIWQSLPGERSKWIMRSSWPCPEKKYDDKPALFCMQKLINLITSIRNVRAFWNISHSTVIEVIFACGTKKNKLLIEENIAYIENMGKCKIKALEFSAVRPAESVLLVSGGIKMFISLGGVIDVKKEKARIEVKITGLETYLKGIEKKLKTESFIKKAPKYIVEKEQEKKKQFEEQLKILRDNLSAL